MSIQAQIDQDIKKAMIARDEGRLSALRMLKSAIKYASIEKPGAAFGDAEAMQVIQKQIKQRRESIQQFTDAGRTDLSSKELAEVAVLEAYLPKQLSEAELKTLVEKEVAAQGATSKKDFGRMMKHLNERLAGGADNKRLSEMLGQLLK
jgi:uncharacterized protein